MLDASLSIRPKFSRIFVLDFETYYSKEYGLKKQTTSEYIREERFQTIGVGVLERGAPAGTWYTEQQFRNWSAAIDWNDIAIIAHHAHFDGLILSHHYDLRPAFWFDTLSMANLLKLRAHVGGSLAKLMAHFGVGEKGSEVHEMLGKRLEDFTADEWQRYGAYCLKDCAGTLAIWERMEPAIPPIEAAVVDITIRCFTEPTLRLDTAMLQEALQTETVRKRELMARIADGPEEEVRKVLSSNPQFAAALTEFGAVPPTKISPTTGKETFAFAKSDPGMKELLEHPDDSIRWLAEARVGVKTTIAESRIGRMLKLVEGDRAAPIYLKVAAAHTDRMGGGDKTNFQNLPRTGPLRMAMTAPPGHVVIACDSGQIEARVLAWLAGQDDLLKGFVAADADPKAEEDVYTRLASDALGRRVTKADKVERGVGKVGILGFGYGMGWRKAAATFLAGPMGAKPIQFTQAQCDAAHVHVEAFAVRQAKAIDDVVSRLPRAELEAHCAMAKHLVDTYRAQNEAIPALWQEAEGWIDGMLGDGAFLFGPGNCLTLSRHAITRPSGLRLTYPGLGQRENWDGYTYMAGATGKEVTKIYGGLLVENVVQALARDIVMAQMVELRWRHNVRIVTTTHDEIVAIAKKEDGERTMQTMIDVMRTPPVWCADLPLNAEAGMAERYGDC